MDLDGDGYRDMITGQYWPGDIYIFRGQKDHQFAAEDFLKDEDDKNLNGGGEWESEDEPLMQSLAAVPFATDWDLDGDMDMLLGNIEGTVTYMENTGDAKQPIYSTNRKTLKADGKKIQVGGGDSGPVHADWDGDGVRDLIVGCGDGSVLFFKNTGADDEPKFAAAEALVGAGTHHRFEFGTTPPRPGTRVKVCVVDYDGDGDMDLLAGDYISQGGEPRELTAAQIKRRDEIKTQMDQMQSKMMTLYEDYEKQKDGLEAKSDELKKLTEDFTAKMEAAQSDDMMDLYSEHSKLAGQNTSHGFVWLYLRQGETDEPVLKQNTENQSAAAQ